MCVCVYARARTRVHTHAYILYIIYKMSRANCNLLALILFDTEKSRIYIFDYIDFDGTKNIERQKCSPKILISIAGAQKVRNRSSFARGTEYSVDCETRDNDIKKQVPKIDSFSSQTLSMNSALLTQFHLERTIAEKKTMNDAKKYGIFSHHIICLLK